MYRENREAVNGFVKNLFAAFDFRLLPYLFIFLWLAVMFLEPLIVLLLLILGQAPLARAIDLAVCIGLSSHLAGSLYRFQSTIRLAFMYPLTILANEVVAFQSLRHSLVGRLSWKGRIITRPHWRWL